MRTKVISTLLAALAVAAFTAPAAAVASEEAIIFDSYGEQVKLGETGNMTGEVTMRNPNTGYAFASCGGISLTGEVVENEASSAALEGISGQSGVCLWAGQPIASMTNFEGAVQLNGDGTGQMPLRFRHNIGSGSVCQYEGTPSLTWQDGSSQFHVFGSLSVKVIKGVCHEASIDGNFVFDNFVLEQS